MQKKLLAWQNNELEKNKVEFHKQYKVLEQQKELIKVTEN